MRAQVAEILNDDQRAKMDEMHAKRGEHRETKHAARHKHDCAAAKPS